MATKPGTVPVWNTGGANNFAPSGAKKILGWEVGEEPPSSFFNWLQKLYGEWFQYLSDGIFTGGIDVTGATADTGIIGRGGTGNAVGVAGIGSGNQPGVTGTGTTNARGGLFTGNGTGVGAVGNGGSNAAGGAFTAGGGNNHGATGLATGTGSGLSGTAAGSSGFGVRGTGVSGGVGGIFASSATDIPVIKSDGFIDLSGATRASASTALDDKITPIAFAKAMGVINFNGTSAPSVVGAQNITSVAQAAGGDITVTMAQAIVTESGFNTINAVANALGIVGFVTYTPTSTTVITFAVWDAAGVQINRATLSGVAMSMLIFGVM